MAEHAENAWQTWQMVTAIFVFIFAVLGAGAAARAWVDKRFEAESRDRNVQVAHALQKAEEARSLNHQLELQMRDAIHDVEKKAADAVHELELRVAKDYASFKVLNGVKEDIMDSVGEVKASVNKIGDRLDTILLDRASAAS